MSMGNAGNLLNVILNNDQKAPQLPWDFLLFCAQHNCHFYPGYLHIHWVKSKYFKNMDNKVLVSVDNNKYYKCTVLVLCLIKSAQILNNKMKIPTNN